MTESNNWWSSQSSHAEGLTSEKLEAFAETLCGAPRDEPDTIWITHAWSDDQIRRVVNCGVRVICDKPTFERIERIRNKA